MKKTRSEKSRDTVPLRDLFQICYFYAYAEGINLDRLFEKWQN